MNNQGQVVVLRELFSFAMGVIVMLGILSIFTGGISPELLEYSVNEQSYSTLFHFHSLFEKSLSLARTVSNGVVSVTRELPEGLAGQPYRVYVDNNQLCVRTRGDVSLLRCINMTVPAVVSGNYLSGTDLELNATLNDSSLSISFDNYLS